MVIEEETLMVRVRSEGEAIAGAAVRVGRSI